MLSKIKEQKKKRDISKILSFPIYTLIFFFLNLEFSSWMPYIQLEKSNNNAKPLLGRQCTLILNAFHLNYLKEKHRDLAHLFHDFNVPQSGL